MPAKKVVKKKTTRKPAKVNKYSFAQNKTFITAAVFIFGAACVGAYVLLTTSAATVSPHSITPGAKLPISYDLNTLSGTKRYVATNGSDSTGNGSVSAPYATLAKAISVAASKDSIVIRGGFYRQGNVTVPQSKSLNIVAYPGEIPEFRGSKEYSGGWTTEGSFKYRSYTPRPVTDGSGISFTSGQNLTGDGIGKRPDQAWINNLKQLRQVASKSSLKDGSFWVDASNNRIYLTANDISKGTIEVSDKNVFLSVYSPNTAIKGLRVKRYSNSANDYGVIKIHNTADNNRIENVYISDTAFIALQYIGDSNLNTGSTIKNSTIHHSNWMGVSATYTDNLTLDSVTLTDMNIFDEFTYSPQSGALKTSRTRYTKVTNSLVSNNHSHGLWFDQSNYDVDVAGNKIVDNLGTGLFFEISDNLLLINNYIKSSGGARAVKLAGSSGLKLINNTVIGGADPIGVYVDSRSKPGCADPSKPLCEGSYNSDRDTVRSLPPTMDWIPRIDYMINNIIVYPTATGYCGSRTALCITSTNGAAKAPIQSVIHKADTNRSIRQTYMNNNVYANGTGKIINTSIGTYSTVSSFMNAMAVSPVNISGLEASGKYGNSYVNADGSATSNLNHTDAYSIPTNTEINQYVPAGTKRFGVL